MGEIFGKGGRPWFGKRGSFVNSPPLSYHSLNFHPTRYLLDDIHSQNALNPPKIIEEKITQERLSLESESISSSLPEPISVEGAIGRKDGVDDSGFEYDIGFSREILVGDSQRLRREESRLNYEADLLDAES